MDTEKEKKPSFVDVMFFTSMKDLPPGAEFIDWSFVAEEVSKPLSPDEVLTVYEGEEE